MAPIRLVVLDMAGTTVQDNDNVANCVQAVFSEVGIRVSLEDCNAVMGMAKPVAIAKLLEQSGRERDVAALFSRFEDHMEAHYRTSPDVRQVEGAESAISALRAAGIKVALDTGFSRRIAHVIIERLGWMDKVDAVVCSDEVEHGRPAPDLVFEAMRRTGVSSSREVVKVGDARADIEEGARADCAMVIGVLSGSHTREQLESTMTTALIDSVADLPALLLGETAKA